MPERIQLSRKRGWRKPENTIVVARPGRWGNPVLIHPVRPSGPFDIYHGDVGFIGQVTGMELAREKAVEAFRRIVDGSPEMRAEILAELAGKNLACWCPLDQPCHADVLLELANTEPGDD
ncbi:DUF4326 domain-containing protein [Microbacterium halotolerans]|uniref:DUF4326 domain-containing protein n=1 Tax=Microbacterium halotolerans TaxID=246613 RepID=UPI000E6AB397|nr:DUF4326 domain-containing protein [Microbacterium halotolerans]